MQQRWAKSEAEMCGEGASATKRGGTLVVCPTIALKQWQSELARFVKPGTLKVVIHHGANRATRAEVNQRLGKAGRWKRSVFPKGGLF